MPKKINTVETAVETVTTPEGVTSTAPAKKVVKKVAAKKVTVKKFVKKAATKAVKAVKSAEPGKPREGLNKPQIRILACLAKSGKALTRKEISERAPVDNAFCTEYIGSIKDDIRAKADAIRPSLITLKYVKFEIEDIDGRNTTMYSITAAGKNALEKTKK